MKRRYILYRRKLGGTFYVEDTQTRKQESLGTKDRREAETLLNARNEAARQPHLNLQIAKAYLAGTDSGDRAHPGHFIWGLRWGLTHKFSSRSFGRIGRTPGALGWNWMPVTNPPPWIARQVSSGKPALMPSRRRPANPEARETNAESQPADAASAPSFLKKDISV